MVSKFLIMKPGITILVLLSASLTLFSACGSADDLPGRAEIPENYPEPVEEWQEYRIGVLTDSTGWLRLVDLIWLSEGENRFGSSEEADIQFPEGSITEFAGIFHKEDMRIRIEVSDETEIIEHESGEMVRSALIFDPDSEEDPPHLRHGTLRWFIDQRGDQLGVRLYDMNTPKADEFSGFPRYEVDESWVREARFIPADEDHEIEVVNVQGDLINRHSPGKVEFTINGELLSLDAFEANSGLFLMFTDQTGRDETYQAGRYMIIDFPDDDNRTVIDFNKAYNPPCAFSPHTTCQLPPPQNRLDVSITAGEKRPVGWDGVEDL